MAFVIGNRIKVATGTTGTGTVTLSTTAEDGFQNFADGGIANSDVVRYTIEDGTDFEIGNGTYNSGTSTLTRTLLESSTGSLLNLSGDAIVFVTAAAEDLQLKDSSGNISVSGNITVTGTVDGRDVATDGTKLDNIEANADVTDATNVSGAGALMTSGGTMSGTITFASGQQFDGRDVSADGSKLDGIETGATADQTKSDIDALGIDAASVGGVGISNLFQTNQTETTRTMQPEAGNTYDVGGGTSNYYRYGYFNRLYYGAWYSVSDTSDRMQWGAINAVQIFFNNSEEFRFTDTGVLHADNNVIAYSSTISDERLKYDINKIGNALDKVSELSGYTFKYKHRDRLSGGVIAQEVEKVLPEAVKEQDLPLQTDDGINYKTVNYNAIQGLLIEAVKELKTQVQDLKAEIEELKNGSSN